MKKKSSSNVIIYKRLLSYVRPHFGFFGISILGFLLYSATQPLFAALVKHIIDTLQTEKREEMMYLPLFFSGLIFVRGIGSYLGNYFLARVSSNVVHALRSEVFNKYTRLPTAYFDANNSGYMISRITHNVGQVTQATTDSVRTFVREGLTALGLLAYLFFINWQLSLVFICIAPVILVMVSYVSKRLRTLSKRLQDSVGDMTHITSELVNGHRVVRSYGGEVYEKNRFKERSLFNSNNALKVATTLAIHSPLMQLLIGVMLSVLMYLALYFMKQTSAGEFVGYLTAAFLLPRPIRQLSDANGDIQKGIAAAESLFAVLDEEEEVDIGSYETGHCEGRLEFKHVSFRYPGGQDLVINNISFNVLPGQTVALVGASGGGKSTLVSLVSRFYEYTQGEILLDGVDIKQYTRANLLSHIALVTQQVTLFNDTVANNIAYGELAGKGRQQIIDAATDAYATDFIEKFEQGFDTEIGEHGVKLSGGQRQRLALARALLKDAPILILDEATSALDTESERYIQRVLKRIMQNRTTLVVAHRLSTIENADQIIVIDHGQIIEIGVHAELIAKDGAYARLHKTNFEKMTN
ncbi:MAG: lipid A export permease/ATP-binding protein MsbA [Methylococcales bacterium]